MTNAFEAVCAGTRVRITGFGLARPLSRPVEIAVNGRALESEPASALARDLSRDGAVYRLVALCGRTGSSLQLQIYVGEADRIGRISFAVGSATFLGAELRSYDGLDPAEAESFWFR